MWAYCLFMYRIALTGNVAAGKSSVVRVWRRLGIPVIESDELARIAVEPGSPALREIVEVFGEDVLDESGALHRAAMRRIILRDEARRRDLEAIVHPVVARLRVERERDLQQAGEPFVVNEIPLLFERGLEGDFHRIVLVDAPPEVRLQRLLRERGLPPDDAAGLLRAQLSAEVKRQKAHLIIENAGTLEELEVRAEMAGRELMREFGG